MRTRPSEVDVAVYNGELRAQLCWCDLNASAEAVRFEVEEGNTGFNIVMLRIVLGRE